jgi:hypothetical protein
MLIVAVAFLLLGPVAVVICGQFMFAKALSESAPVRQRGFDPVLWQKPVDVEFGRTTRSEMVEDLLREYSFIGWTPEQVEKLLGPAEPPPAWDNRWDFVYHLGADRTFAPIDHEWLGFSVGEDGKVDAYQTFVD